jgi:AraC-like DNA-binding protein
MSFGGVTIGDVVTDGYDAETTSKRVGVAFTHTGKIRYRSGRAVEEAAGSGALLFKPDTTKKSSIRAEKGAKSRTLHVLVPHTQRLKKLGLMVPPVMPVGGAPEAHSLRGLLTYVFSELQRADSPLRRPNALDAIEALIVDMVDGLYNTHMANPAADAGAASRVRAALDFMYANADEALTVEQIARTVGVGPRRLQAAFRSELGKSPREMLAEIRLENAHGLLLAPEAWTTVTDVAFERGFAHLGRFSAAYRQRYGESPSQTLLRARR